MDEIAKAVVVTALKDMFKSSSFSICTIDKCLKITHSIPEKKDYDMLSALHCIHWSEMAPELRSFVFSTTIKMLSCEGFDLSVLDMVFNKENNVFELPKKKGFKLLNFGKGE